MSSIDKIVLGTTTYTLKDNNSGYGTFTATQGMQSTVTGATLVGTLKYRTFAPTSGAFGATNTVNLYSTPGGLAGNNYTASVSGNVLKFISAENKLMPDLSSTVASDVPAALEAVGLISSTSGKIPTYTLLCNSLMITNINTVGGVTGLPQTMATYVNGSTFDSFDIVNIPWSKDGVTNWTVTERLQSPAAGTPIDSNTSVTLTYKQTETNSGGGSGEMS